VGDVITVTVTFDQSVTVTGGTPTLLETGLVDRNATYVSGSGSNILTFSYTVQAGMSAPTGLPVHQCPGPERRPSRAPATTLPS
jgi:hypothetical protein